MASSRFTHFHFSYLLIVVACSYVFFVLFVFGFFLTLKNIPVRNEAISQETDSQNKRNGDLTGITVLKVLVGRKAGVANH